MEKDLISKQLQKLKEIKKFKLRYLAYKIIKLAKDEKEVITEKTLSHYFTGKRKPDHKRLKILADALKVPVGYFYGEYDISPDGKLFKVNGEVIGEDFIAIKMVNARVSAGGGSVEFNYINDESGERYAFRRDWIKRVATSPKNLFLTKVIGDSMYDKLKEGDIILVDTGRKEIQSNKIYVVRSNDEVFVKILNKLPSGKIKVRSYNENYPEFEVSPEDNFEVIGKVIWAGVDLA